MLENDGTEKNDTQEDKHSPDNPEDTVKKPRKRRRRLPAKKSVFLAGPWPKIAIAAIVLCLGLVGFSSFFLMVNRDKTVPVIQNISISDIAQTSAIINWQTNEPATGEVTVCSSDNCTSLKKDESLVTNHSATLTNIEPNTGYQLTIVARNKQGNEVRFALELVTPRKTTAVEIGTRIGDRAPDFTLPTIDGKETSLSSFRGKVVMVNFWQSSCPACTKETPYIQAVFDGWPRDKLEILAISVDERAAFVQSFIDSKGLTFPVLLDSDGAVSKTYQVDSYPTTFFVNADGIIKGIKSGHFTSQSEIEDMLKSF